MQEQSLDITEVGSSPNAPRVWRRRLWAALQIVAVLVILALIVREVLRNDDIDRLKDALGAALARGWVVWALLAASLAVNLGASLVYVGVWREVARRLGSSSPRPYRAALLALSLAGAARYLPGAIWPVAGLILFGPAVGLPRRIMPVLSALAQGLHVLLALTIAIVGLFIWFAPPGGPAATTIFGLALGVALLVAVLTLALRYVRPGIRWLEQVGTPVTPEPPSPPTSLLHFGPTLLMPAGWSLGFWIANGLRLWLLAVALGPTPGSTLASPIFYIWAGALSAIAATLFFFVPLGLGVVEASLIWAVAPALGPGGALAFVALNRLSRLFNDALYTLLGYGIYRRHHRETPL